jgi:hypothetical protein
LKVFRLHTKSKKLKEAELKLVRKIWKFSKKLKMKKEGGRMGEALDRVGPESKRLGETGPLEKGGIGKRSPPLTCRGPVADPATGVDLDHPAPVQGPKHPADGQLP